MSDTNLIACKRCGSQIHPHQRCSYCGYDNQQLNLRPWYTHWYVVVVFIMCVLLLAGIIRDKIIRSNIAHISTPVDTVPIVSVSPAVVVPPSTEKEQYYGITEVATFNSFEFLINEFSPITLDSSQAQPAEGNGYYSLKCELRNISNNSITIQGDKIFTLYDDKTNVIPASFKGQYYSDRPQLKGILGINETLKGEVIVEIPNNSYGIRLVFKEKNKDRKLATYILN